MNTLWALGLILGVGGLTQASIQTILDRDHQGQGNKGTIWRPADIMGDDAFFLLSARSSVDDSDPWNPDATGLTGTVYVDRDGTGVQTLDARGSKGISGGGGHKDEELIFTFDAAILASSIVLELIDITFNDDDPVLFVSTGGSGVYGYTILEAEIQAAFTSTGNKKGIIDFSMLSSLAPGLTVDSFKIRETDGHIEVSGLANAIPEPATLALIGFGATALFRRRRRAI